MNWVGRAVAEIGCRNRVVGQSYSYLSTKAKKAVVDWARPSEIPYQVKVANSINLTGYVDMPVQFKPSPSSDGKDWAATIINQIPSSHSPPLWIPVIFEGDLAQIVASHLKPNDHVHIAGQLIADAPTHDAIQPNANVQVMAHSVNFIELHSKTKKCDTSQKQEEAPVNDSVSTKKDGASIFCSWLDLLDKPKEWWDCRSNKLTGLLNPRYPDFKRKDGKGALWLNRAPKQILPKLEGVEFDVLTNKSKYPKQSNGVEFDVQTDKSKYPKQRKGEEFWKDLVENPGKWWDNRLDKKTEKSPDFKHKETGKALWLTYSPAWVRSKLPAPKSKQKWPSAKSKQNAVTDKRDTLLS